MNIMFFGGSENDHLQFQEGSLWAGGPVLIRIIITYCIPELRSDQGLQGLRQKPGIGEKH